MFDDADVQSHRQSAKLLISDAIEWLQAGDHQSDTPEVERDLSELLDLRDRAGSILLKIGVIGTFSSGKSFLINGLQGHLTYSEDGSSRVRKNVRYFGLLPSSREPTTAAPTIVRPVERADAQAEALLRVRFLGDRGQWNDAGEAVPARISAYVTDNPELLENRKPEHRSSDKKVAEVEIEIQEHLIDALFYDLPGVGSPNPAHDEIVRGALQQADSDLRK